MSARDSNSARAQGRRESLESALLSRGLGMDRLLPLGVPLAQASRASEPPTEGDLAKAFLAAADAALTDRERDAFRACALAISHFFPTAWARSFGGEPFAGFLEYRPEDAGRLVKLRRIAAAKLGEFL